MLRLHHILYNDPLKAGFSSLETLLGRCTLQVSHESLPETEIAPQITYNKSGPGPIISRFNVSFSLITLQRQFLLSVEMSTNRRCP
jgi:hypothetical protein